MPPIDFTIAMKYGNRVTKTYFGWTPIRLPTVCAEQLRAAEVERGVDLVVAVAGDVDPRVAGHADDARRAGPGVDRRPAGARRPGVWVMSSPGRASEPTARIEITSGPMADAWALSTLTSVDLGAASPRSPGTTSATTASTSAERRTSRCRAVRPSSGASSLCSPSRTSYPKTCQRRRRLG